MPHFDDVSGRPLRLRDVNLDVFLHPRTVAVIGASEARGKPNAAMTRRIKEWADEHDATFFPVHPMHEAVLGVPCSPTIADVPGEKWVNLDAALRLGRRGLPRGTNLTRLIAEHRGTAAPPAAATRSRGGPDAPAADGAASRA